jgi:hypothetical protein
VSVKRANTGKAAPAEGKRHVSCGIAGLHFTQVPGIMRGGEGRAPAHTPAAR